MNQRTRPASAASHEQDAPDETHSRRSWTKPFRASGAASTGMNAEAALDPELLHRTRESFLAPSAGRSQSLLNLPSLLGAAISLSALFLLGRYLFALALGLEIPASVLQFSDDLPVLSGLVLLLSLVFMVLRRPRSAARATRRPRFWSRKAAEPSPASGESASFKPGADFRNPAMRRGRSDRETRGWPGGSSETYESNETGRSAPSGQYGEYDPLDAFLNRTGRSRAAAGSSGSGYRGGTAGRNDDLDPYALNRKKRLFRSRQDVRLFGVCGGLARYFGINSTFVRLGFILGLLTWGTTFVIYVVLMLLMPKEPTDWMRPGSPFRNGR